MVRRDAVMIHWTHELIQALVIDVSVISATNYFNFTPLLASTAVGTLEYRCAIEPVRPIEP